MKNIKEFCENCDKIYIFGNGKGGGNLAEVLDYIGIDYEGFLISEKYTKGKGKKNGKPVSYLSEIRPSENTGIILACSPLFYNEVINEVLDIGFCNVYFASQYFSCGYALRKLKKLGVDTSRDVLNMNDKFSIINLFPHVLDDERALLTYIGEFPDLGYHYLGQDSSCFDEGPYEFEDVIFAEDYEGINEQMVKYVRLHEGDVVFDCGANIGMFSAAAAAKKCKVYAFEPSPEQIKYLEKTKALYPDNIEIVNKAIANYNGTAKFNICPYYNGGDSLIYFDGNDSVDVDVVTLDSFVQNEGIEKVSFIKADLEAAERLLLRGAIKVLREHQPILSLCTYHRADDVEVLTRLIKESNPNYNIAYGWKKIYAWVDR